MDKAAAITIIESLANGVDPFTGDNFPNNSALQNADVVRALYFALSKLNNNLKITVLPNNIDDLIKSEQEEMWKEYCKIIENENPHSCLDTDDDSEEDEETEECFYEDDTPYEDDEPYDYYDKDSEDTMNDIREEIYENMENNSSSEEAGWYYPNSEGSWEDNLSVED